MKGKKPGAHTRPGLFNQAAAGGALLSLFQTGDDVRRLLRLDYRRGLG
jgi:hypothetical protein